MVGVTSRRRIRRIATAGVFVLALAAPVLAAHSANAAAAFPNDPYFPEQWNLTKIGAPAAWSKATGAGVIVGVVDTGIDLGHVDLAGKVVASTNCIGANDDPLLCHGSAQDDQGHGTHVSGIIAADTNNAIGVAGVAPDARLVVAKALSSNGSGALDDVNAGIKWVVDHGAKIVNLSIEADTGIRTLPGQTLTEGVEYAYSHGAIAVVAAGNSTPSLFGGGSAFSSVNVVVVGATGPNDEVAFYSSSLGAAKWGLVAPGGDAKGPDGRPSCAASLASQCIVSTGWFPGHTNQYADDEGTSMAAPEVAATIALLMGPGSGLSRDAALARMLDATAKIPCGPGCRGRLDVAAAAQVKAPPPPPPSPTTTTTSTVPATAVPVVPPAVAPAGSVGSGVASAPRATTTTGASKGTPPVPTSHPSATVDANRVALRPQLRHSLPGRVGGSGSGTGTTVAETVAALLVLVVGPLLGRRIVRGGAAR
jgi:subtilisin family serine protease